MHPDSEALFKLKDVANAAGVLAHAATNAPKETQTVNTPYGTAEVVVDESGTDVVLHTDEVTVHVRPT